MATPDLRRRLLAILAADAAGYSRLVAVDDRATISALDEARAVFRSEVSRHAGRVIDTAGDSVLAVFESATASVEAALAIQELLEKGRRGGAQLQFRIGLHLGDVLEHADGTVYGDGVNVASRLQALAAPGGIAASDAMRNASRGRVNATFADLGRQAVKNIDEPIQTYRVSPGAPPNPQEAVAFWRVRGPLSSRKLRLGVAGGVLCLAATVAWFQWQQPQGIPASAGKTGFGNRGVVADAGPLSIVVLPFANLTGDASQDFVSAGLTASITGDLQRIRDAYVVSAATAKAYTARSLAARQIGNELGVRYVLQGSVQRNGTRLRINAQLADTSNDSQLWSEAFDGDSSDLFALQDQVTTRISTSIGRELVVRAARESERRKGNATAGELLLQARGVELRPRTLENLRTIEALYRQVLKSEPDSVAALGGLAVTLMAQVSFLDGQDQNTAVVAKMVVEAERLATRSRTLDVDSPLSYRALSQIAGQRGDWDEAVRQGQARLALEPKSQSAFNSLAFAYYWRGEPQLALPLLKEGLALDPKHPYEGTLFNLAKVELMLGRYDAAIDWWFKGQAANPAFGFRDPTLVVAYELRGDHAKARATAAVLVKSDPGFTLSWAAENVRNTGLEEYYGKTLIPAMRQAGVPE